MKYPKVHQANTPTAFMLVEVAFEIGYYNAINCLLSRYSRHWSKYEPIYNLPTSKTEVIGIIKDEMYFWGESINEYDYPERHIKQVSEIIDNLFPELKPK